MRSKKNGETAIPKIIWQVKARMHHGFVQDLTNAGLNGGLVTKHTRLAEACEILAADTKKGRPADKSYKNVLAAIVNKSKKIGCEHQKIDDEEAFFFMIEEMRQTQSVQGTIEELLCLSWAEGTGTKRKDYVDKNLPKLRSKYYRGRKKTVQK